MQGLQEQLSSLGFSIPKMELTGKIIRFKRENKMSGWFIGWQNLTKKGDAYVIAEFGDWRTGEKYDYKTVRKYTKAEQKEIKTHLKEASEARSEDEKKMQAAAARETTDLFEKAVLNKNCDYLKDKKIEELYGCKTQITSTGRSLLVPMVDTEGKLWGMQTIFPNGKKYFYPGQRIKGTFHQIGEIEDGKNIYLCEGFSTGAAIYASINRPVVIGFNAGNLLSVAKSLSQTYKKSTIVICADDDKWTENNPGREYGEKAKKAVLGQIVFPDFDSLETKPTDFNDLYILEGKKKVAQIILSLKEHKNYLLHLGHSNGIYYYTSSSNEFITAIKSESHSKLNLLNVMPMAYWETMYPKDSGPNWTLAAADMMDQCRKKGVFSGEKVRGTGAWKDDGKLLINLGDSIWQGGVSKSIHSVKSKYVYQIGKQFNAPKLKPLTLGECQFMLEALHLLNWKDINHLKYLAGWLATAPICGALDWRPHIWLTGPSGTGKSYIMNNLVHKIIKKYGEFCVGTTTEAGLRQQMGCDSRPVVFDEFETNDDKSARRISGILELFRQASSETEASVFKGSSFGSAIKYSPRFSAIVSSVRVSLNFEADSNRFSVLELKRGGTPENFEKIQKAFSMFDEKFAERLFARSVQMFDIFEANRQNFWLALAEKFNPRFGQQYGALLAGYSILESDNILSIEEINFIVDSCNLQTVQDEESPTEDERECLDYILSKTCTIDGGFGLQQRSVLELIQRVDDESLRRLGMHVENDELFVANRHPSLTDFFKKTKWGSGWSKSLSRIVGAERVTARRFWGTSTRSVKIPFSCFN